MRQVLSVLGRREVAAGGRSTGADIKLVHLSVPRGELADFSMVSRDERCDIFQRRE